MPEISAKELHRLKLDAQRGRQARKADEARRANRTGNGLRERSEVDGLGSQVERAFREQAAAAGWDVSKRGWPDFILRRGRDVAFVEVKAHAGKALKPEQQEIALLLAQAGFRVYRWSPEGGFERTQPPREGLRTPGGATEATEPATRGAEHSRHPTPYPGQGAPAARPTAPAAGRVGQGTRSAGGGRTVGQQSL